MPQAEDAAWRRMRLQCLRPSVQFLELEFFFSKKKKKYLKSINVIDKNKISL